MHKAGILSVADTLDKVNCTYINPCAHNFMVVFAEYIRVRLRCARILSLFSSRNFAEYIRVRLRCASSQCSAVDLAASEYIRVRLRCASVYALVYILNAFEYIRMRLRCATYPSALSRNFSLKIHKKKLLFFRGNFFFQFSQAAFINISS